MIYCKASCSPLTPPLRPRPQLPLLSAPLPRPLQPAPLPPAPPPAPVSAPPSPPGYPPTRYPHERLPGPPSPSPPENDKGITLNLIRALGAGAGSIGGHAELNMEVESDCSSTTAVMLLQPLYACLARACSSLSRVPVAWAAASCARLAASICTIASSRHLGAGCGQQSRDGAIGR